MWDTKMNYSERKSSACRIRFPRRSRLGVASRFTPRIRVLVKAFSQKAGGLNEVRIVRGYALGGEGGVKEGLIKGCTHVNLSRKKLFNLKWRENKIMKLFPLRGSGKGSCESKRDETPKASHAICDRTWGKAQTNVFRNSNFFKLCIVASSSSSSSSTSEHKRSILSRIFFNYWMVKMLLPRRT